MYEYITKNEKYKVVFYFDNKYDKYTFDTEIYLSKKFILRRSINLGNIPSVYYIFTDGKKRIYF